MKVALCLSGEMRCYQKSYPVLQESLLDQFPDMDIYIYTWDRVGPNKSRNMGNVYNHFFIQGNDSPLLSGESLKEDLIRVYQPKKIVVEEWKDSYCNEIEGVIRPTELRKGQRDRWTKYTIPMYWSIKKCYEMLEGDYDIVIKARSDIRFSKFPEEVLDNLDCLWYFPKDHNESHVVSDKFAFASQEVMNDYCHVFDRLNEYWDGKFRSDEGYILANEMILWYHYQNSDIEVRSFGDQYYDARRAEQIKKAGGSLHKDL